MRARKKLSNNAERREVARQAEKLAKARERLAKLESGGAPERPIEVPSASVIEVHARALPCLRCSYECRVVGHTAEVIGGAPLWSTEPMARRVRVVALQCIQCGTRREVYFRILSGSQVN